MSKEGVVYLLEDPRNNEIKYVGATTDAKRRYLQHRSSRCHDQMRKWFKELEEEGEQPNMRIVACANVDELEAVEKRWMQIMESHFNLLNRNKNITYNSKKLNACQQ